MDSPNAAEIMAMRQRLDGATISTLILVMLAVPAKLWATRISRGTWRPSLDDGLAVVTLVFVLGMFFNVMVGLRPYLGRHVGPDVTMEELGVFLKFIFSTSIAYVTSIAFIKFTVLAWYWKLFSVTARVTLHVFTAIVAMWLLGCWLIIIFSCNPVQAQWDLSLRATATCIDPRNMYLGASIPNVVMDVVLVLMPFQVVWKLRGMPIAQRVVLGGIFALGTFVSIVSIVRLQIVMAVAPSSQDVTYDTPDFLMWSVVECNIGLVCACLPSMRPILGAIGLDRFFTTMKSSSSRGAHSGAINPSESGPPRSHKTKRPGFFTHLAALTQFDTQDDSFQMIEQDAAKHGRSQTDVEAPRTSLDTDTDSKGDPLSKEASGIAVQREWKVFVDENGRPIRR